MKFMDKHLKKSEVICLLFLSFSSGYCFGQGEKWGGILFFILGLLAFFTSQVK